VTDGSASAKFLASQTPGDLSLIGKLPAGKHVYLGLKADVSSMIEWSMNLTKGMLNDASDEQKGQFEDAVKQMGKLKYEEMGMYLGIARELPAFRGGAVSVVTPARNLRDITHKLMKSMSEIRTPVFVQKSTLEVGAEKIGGADVDRVTIKQEFDDSADPLGIQKKITSVLFGEEGIQQLAMYQANRVLQTTGGGKAEMQNLVTSLESPKPNDAAAAAARKRFSDKANVVVLADLARAILAGLKLAIDEEAIPIEGDKVDGLKLEPSFLGFALSCESNALRCQFEVPVLQVRNLSDLVKLLH
jgi:hypothetical protein